MNKFILELLNNDFLICASIAWLIGQFSKPLFGYLIEKEWNPKRILEPGGMPSSHTAPAVAATTLIGLKQTFSSPLFTLGLLVSLIVMYDASGVRRAAGEQAKILNLLIPEDFKKLRERIGHTPFEVLVGAFLGITVALIYNFVK